MKRISLEQPSAALCASSPAIRVRITAAPAVTDPKSGSHQKQDRLHVCPCHPEMNQSKNLVEVQTQHRRKENQAVYSC